MQGSPVVVHRKTILHMTATVIAAGARTPIGKLSGGLASLSGAELGGKAIAAALDRSGIQPDQVDYVLMGQVLQAGTGQITARQAADHAGIPLGVPATTINKVCLSGMNTIYLAWRMILAGDAEIVVAGGMESMTNAPFLLTGARGGWKLGDQTAVDSLNHDGLFCALEHELMGAATDRYLASTGFDRGLQDEIAAASHSRAATAQKNGTLAEEIAIVSLGKFFTGEMPAYQHLALPAAHGGVAAASPKPQKMIADAPSADVPEVVKDPYGSAPPAEVHEKGSFPPLPDWAQPPSAAGGTCEVTEEGFAEVVEIGRAHV